MSNDEIAKQITETIMSVSILNAQQLYNIVIFILENSENDNQNKWGHGKDTTD